MVEVLATYLWPCAAAEERVGAAGARGRAELRLSACSEPFDPTWNTNLSAAITREVKLFKRPYSRIGRPGET